MFEGNNDFSQLFENTKKLSERLGGVDESFYSEETEQSIYTKKI